MSEPLFCKTAILQTVLITLDRNILRPGTCVVGVDSFFPHPTSQVICHQAVRRCAREPSLSDWQCLINVISTSREHFRGCSSQNIWGWVILANKHELTWFHSSRFVQDYVKRTIEHFKPCYQLERWHIPYSFSSWTRTMEFVNCNKYEIKPNRHCLLPHACIRTTTKSTMKLFWCNLFV